MTMSAREYERKPPPRPSRPLNGWAAFPRNSLLVIATDTGFVYGVSSGAWHFSDDVGAAAGRAVIVRWWKQLGGRVVEEPRAFEHQRLAGILHGEEQAAAAARDAVVDRHRIEMQAVLGVDRAAAAAGDVASSVGEPQAEHVDQIVGSVEGRARGERVADGEDAIEAVAVDRQVRRAGTDDRQRSGDDDRVRTSARSCRSTRPGTSLGPARALRSPPGSRLSGFPHRCRSGWSP